MEEQDSSVYIDIRRHLHLIQRKGNVNLKKIEDEQKQEVDEQEQNQGDDIMIKMKDGEDSSFLDVDKNNQRIKSYKDHLIQF
ncbi:MAG: hypothetical protein EZS28_003593 [Streblomastix strix]|uniref:Uncharacterized protein n=1 Tax=Streblomastix strix TaxID=222440 RepID=A0A5J4X1I5_9EUKA|nr:MAG: hypothetical protein EZS28_003593 [Streblomastix strix]